MKTCFSKSSVMMGSAGLPSLRVQPPRLWVQNSSATRIHGYYTPITQWSLTPGYYHVVVMGFYYSYFTPTLEYDLTSGWPVTMSPYEMGVINSTGDSNTMIYIPMVGYHIVRSLYCYSRLEVGVRTRVLFALMTSSVKSGQVVCRQKWTYSRIQPGYRDVDVCC